MNWIRYTAISISIIALVFSEQIIIACGGSDYYYDSSPAFFGRTTYDQPAFSPFSFEESELYYESEVTTDSINKSIMLLEWQKYFGKSIPFKDIESLIYKGDIQTFEDLKKGQITTPEFKNNALAKALMTSKHKNTLEYLLYAKKCEAVAMDNYSYWSWGWSNDKEAEEVKYSKWSLTDEGLRLSQKEKNNFLKMKYNFQVMRMIFYDKKYEEVLRYFDALLKGKEDKSVAYTRILGFKAGAHFHLGQKAKAAYYYVKMFDNSDAYKLEAMMSFDWAKNNSEAWEQELMSYCQNNHEKAVANVMLGLRAFYDYKALPYMKAAFNLDPNVEGLKILMNREINKLEARYLRERMQMTNPAIDDIFVFLYNYNPRKYKERHNIGLHKYWQEQEEYMHQLHGFVDQVIKQQKGTQKSYWYLTKSYLHSLKGDENKMNEFMQLAKQSGLSNTEKMLYNTIALLYDLQSSRTVDANVEAKILPKLKDLDQLANQNTEADVQFHDFMYYMLAGQYFKQGDTIKGIYAMGHAFAWGKRDEFFVQSDFTDIQGTILNHMSIEELKKVQMFRTKTSKTPFESWLVDKTYYTAEVLKELEATKHMRLQNFKEGVAIFKEINPTHKYPNPFMPQINDYIGLCERDTLRTYTKLTFSERMAELKEIIEKDPKDAGAMYGYAVALYNISYYGKLSEMSMYYRSYTDHMGYFTNEIDKTLPEDIQDYYRVYTAEKYFINAANATKDPELKAKALWGAAKCWTKRTEPGTDVFEEEHYARNALKSPYFKTLKGTLSHTKFMKEVQHTCDYYDKYVRRN